ncbi:flagellar basal-body rod protein FlgG [Planomicrobium koreense]|uniref:Flagellar basal-body rod protein FlgG n=1 Tax=Planococcus koreensis TaxID=112331 RepID=A0A7W8CRQ7_9BACL|nr:flagellar hook-basal body protein [Planococcus koreensis]MBB5179313.1 flagellar basal-body rod protein FlgG [Planococcus koreensis]
MFRGLYTATSGMMAHNRKQQILTNNLANANTPGFKGDQTVLRSFPDQLIKAMGAAKTPAAGHQVGHLSTGVYAQEGIPSFAQGALKSTGNSTDFALMDDLLPVNPVTQERGSLVFAAALPNGEVRYTKNGQFSVGADGLLKTSEGYNVLGADMSPIQATDNNFTVEQNGRITFANGNETNELWIGHTENPQQLVKEGHGLFRWEGTDAQAPQRAADVPFLNNSSSFIQQGFIESSNVDLTQTMTDMMNTYRGFEVNQKVIQAYDRSMEKAANEIGRV